MTDPDSTVGQSARVLPAKGRLSRWRRLAMVGQTMGAVLGALRQNRLEILVPVAIVLFFVAIVLYLVKLVSPLAPFVYSFF